MVLLCMHLIFVGVYMNKLDATPSHSVGGKKQI